MELLIGIAIMCAIGIVGFTIMFVVGWLTTKMFKWYQADKFEKTLIGGLVICLGSLIVVLGNLAFTIGNVILK